MNEKEERIMKMAAEGKISKEEAQKLLDALKESQAKVEKDYPVPASGYDNRIRIAAILVIGALFFNLLSVVPGILVGLEKGKVPLEIAIYSGLVMIIGTLLSILIYFWGWIRIGRIAKLPFLTTMSWINLIYGVLILPPLLIAMWLPGNTRTIIDMISIVPTGILMIIFGISVFPLKQWLGRKATAVGIADIVTGGLLVTILGAPLGLIGIFIIGILEISLFLKASQAFVQPSETPPKSKGILITSWSLGIVSIFMFIITISVVITQIAKSNAYKKIVELNARTQDVEEERNIHSKDQKRVITDSEGTRLVFYEVNSSDANLETKIIICKDKVMKSPLPLIISKNKGSFSIETWGVKETRTKHEPEGSVWLTSQLISSEECTILISESDKLSTSTTMLDFPETILEDITAKKITIVDYLKSLDKSKYDKKLKDFLGLAE